MKPILDQIEVFSLPTPIYASEPLIVGKKQKRKIIDAKIKFLS